MDKLIKLARLWENTSKNGNRYFSGVLGREEVWVVQNEEEAQAVMGDGKAIYYRDEIELLKTKTPEQIRDIHKTKLVFPGCRVVQ